MQPRQPSLRGSGGREGRENETPRVDVAWQAQLASRPTCHPAFLHVESTHILWLTGLAFTPSSQLFKHTRCLFETLAREYRCALVLKSKVK